MELARLRGIRFDSRKVLQCEEIYATLSTLGRRERRAAAESDKNTKVIGSCPNKSEAQLSPEANFLFSKPQIYFFNLRDCIKHFDDSRTKDEKIIFAKLAAEVKSILPFK